LSPSLIGRIYVETFRYGAMACKRHPFTAKNHAGFCEYIDIFDTHSLQNLKLMTHGRHLIQCLLLLMSHFFICVSLEVKLYALLIAYLPTYLLAYLLIHLLTPRSRFLLEKQTGLMLVKKFPSFYGTRMLIAVFTSAHHLSLS
jgi:hypothetical protein